MITNLENCQHILIIDSGLRINEINECINKVNIAIKTIFTDSYKKAKEIISNTNINFILITNGLWRRDEVNKLLDLKTLKNKKMVIIIENNNDQVDYNIDFNNILYTEELTLSKLTKLLTHQEINNSQIINDENTNYTNDSLTNLPNRATLINFISDKIDEYSKSEHEMGLLFLDLDDFKAINDVAGHDIGDKVLQEVALRIERNTRVTDIAARQGGDEFIIFLSDIKDISSAESVANNILNSLSQPICINEECWNITSSIGISIYPHDGKSPDKLLKHADAAMYNAKQAGKNTIRYFNRELGKELDKKYEIIQEVKKAIDNNDFYTELQPQYNLKNDEIIGVELFIRWMHPSRGKLLPDEFLPYIQNTNYISHIGDIILNKAILLSEELKSIGLDNVKIAINVEARQLINDSFIKNLEKLKSQQDFLKSLILEIDETSFLSNFNAAKKRLQKLKSLGITICLDNLGYGTSSLMPVIELPIDIMKFDNKISFSNGVNEAAKEIIIFTAHALGKKVMAKRIDDTTELHKLIKFGCDYGQGFCFEKMHSTSASYNKVKNIKVA